MLATANKQRRIRRTSSGVELPRTADGRTVAAKRFRHLVEQFANELGGDELSGADRSRIRQAACLQMEEERFQEAVVRGEAVDVDGAVRVSSEKRRILSRLKATADRRKPADGPSLDDLFAVDAEAGAE